MLIVNPVTLLSLTGHASARRRAAVPPTGKPPFNSTETGGDAGSPLVMNTVNVHW